MREQQRPHDRGDLAPALGIVAGSAVLLTLVVAVSSSSAHVASAIAAGAASGLLAALGVQLWRRR